MTLLFIHITASFSFSLQPLCSVGTKNLCFLALVNSWEERGPWGRNGREASDCEDSYSEQESYLNYQGKMHYSFIMHLNFRGPFDAGGKKRLSRIFLRMFYEKDSWWTWINFPALFEQIAVGSYFIISLSLCLSRWVLNLEVKKAFFPVYFA